MTGEVQTQETKTLPSSGTVYSIPHPKAFTAQSYILLDRSADEAARKGPTLLDLLGDEQKGKGFLKNVFSTVSQLRNLGAPKQDFFAIFHSTTPETNPNRVSQQAYFHGHVVVGDRDDRFIKAVRESRAYGQGKPDAKLDEAIRLQRYEGVAAKLYAHALAEVFEPEASHRLAPFHRILTVNDGDLEETLRSDYTIEGIRKLLLANISEASARTGVRLAIDTFSDPDSNGRTGLVIHMLGDLNDEPLADKTGKLAQRRWFEIPKP